MCESTYAELMDQLPEGLNTPLDEVLQLAAERMLTAVLLAEASSYVERYAAERDGRGHALVVRNGHARARSVVSGSGLLRVRAPRVDDRRPGHHFRSAVLPPYMRKSPRVEEAVPILYLRGLSTGDFMPALKALLGEAVAGFSPSTISRLKEHWLEEYREWRKRDLSQNDYAYLWFDGVRFHVRMEEEDLHCLVVIGVRRDGKKEILAIEDGYRESTESWLAVLRDLKRRGLNSFRLAVADGALGLWAALPEVFPGVDQQLCWKHKLANVLDKLPKRVQPRAKEQLHEIMYAATEADARSEVAAFEEDYEAKYPKAVASLSSNLDRLLTFFAYPAEHWIHLRTTNPIESSFSTAKLRSRGTRGAGSRNAALGMTFKLLTSAEERWRRVNAPHLVATVIEGVPFHDGLPTAPKRDGLSAETPPHLDSRAAA